MIAFMIKRIPPLMLALIITACSVVPEEHGETKVAMRPHHLLPTVSLGDKAHQCLTRLGYSGSQFSPLPDHFLANGCKNQNTVSLRSLGADKEQIKVTHLGATACPTANAFTDWARYGVDRTARQILGSGVAQIETMGSYVCRKVAGSKRMSGHGRAEAIDVAAFVLKDGRRVSVLDDWEQGNPSERQFLRAVQQRACGRFGVVLGPEYNSAHKNHFHLETRPGSPFCR